MNLFHLTSFLPDIIIRHLNTKYRQIFGADSKDTTSYFSIKEELQQQPEIVFHNNKQ